MAVDLPDEILSEILTPALHVSDELFCRTSGTPFATYTESTSVLLVVPKDWLRVSTPLLYNVVVLRSKAQAKALDATLKQNASLGRFIKKLRVEGGFGQHMHGILKTAVNITDVHLSLLLHSSDSSSGLVLGLPLINPKRLILSDDYEHPLGNKHVVPLLNTLEICAKNWTNLATVIFPYEDITHHRASILLTLCDAPRVTTISFPSPPFGPGITTYFDKIAENPSLHTIEIRGEHVHKWAKRNLPLPDGSRLAKVVKLVDTSVPRSNLPLARFKPPICLPANASFRPMASSPQTTTDIIWDRVLFFALNFPFSPTTAMALIQARMYKQELLDKRNCLLVSKTFHRLGLPRMYRHPSILSQRSMEALSASLRADPSLGRHVCGLNTYNGVTLKALPLISECTSFVLSQF